ncbi:MAG: hypothetical protein PVI70_05475, partial [Gammaproteobacteria bacterium]
WARAGGFEYRFLGDEIFESIDPPLRDRLGERTAIASDLARLRLLQRGLAEGYRRVVWCDADFLVFRPRELRLPETDFGLGREVWVQPDDNGSPKSYFRVHNAMLAFARDNVFLDFYADTAERLLRLNEGGMPPQFVGPKLLSALHNIAHFPVIERAAMLSPMVIRDLLAGGGEALALLVEKSPESPAGANLCSSLTAGEGLGEAEMNRLIDHLIEQGISSIGMPGD